MNFKFIIKLLILFIAVLMIVPANGFISIPDSVIVISHRNNEKTESFNAQCFSKLPDDALYSSQKHELDSNGFRLLNWNVKKNKHDGWEQDFRQHSQDSDLVILQEAYLTENLSQLLQETNYVWDLPVAFTLMDTNTGVLTASKVSPDFLCALRTKEPLIRTPKTSLVTRYALSDTDQTLLLVNSHFINFTVNSREFAQQIYELRSIMAGHHGPIILAGDFNTWSDERIAIIETAINSLNLQEVTFSKGDQSTFFDHPLDHIYFRGLEYQEASAPQLFTSDHNPLIVTFKLSDIYLAGY